MTSKEITLYFAFQLLTMSEDPNGFVKYQRRVAATAWNRAHHDIHFMRAVGWAKDNAARRNENYRKLRSDNPEYYRNRRRELDRSRRGKINAGERLRKETDPEFKLAQAVRRNVRTAMKRNLAGKKSHKTHALLALSMPEFVSNMENSFKPGMNWANYGSVWELDHIRPCASFDLSDPNQQKECFHWGNWRPEFKSANRSKGARWGGRDYRGSR